MVGLAKTKGSMIRYVEKEMLDAVGSLPKDYFKDNPTEFDRVMEIMLKNETRLGYLSQLDDTYWNEIIKSSQNPPVGEQYNAMMFFKEDSSPINNMLTHLKNGTPLPPDIIKNKVKLEKYIKYIEEYLNTTHLDRPIKVYRDDDYGILSKIKLENNITLEDRLKYLKNLLEEGNNEKFNIELKKIPMGIKMIQERFMSTTFVKENRFKKTKPIRWEFDIPKGTKGTFIESYNDATLNGKQIEYLLQRDSKIIIKNIEWSDEFDCWYIKADIIQN